MNLAVVGHPSTLVDAILEQAAARGISAECVASLHHADDFDCVAFDLPSTDESVLLDDAADFSGITARIDADLIRFLAEIRNASVALARRGGGKIFVLTQEDSASYYLTVPQSPIASRARIAAAKSLAKEVFRMGVEINVLDVQSFAEQAPESAWTEARADLKAYALRFHPVTAAAVARAVVGLCAMDCRCFAGMVIPVGVGFPEGNL